MKQRDMRKSNDSLSWEDSLHILQNQLEGVLGVTGLDGYPYCIPMNFVFADSKIILHSASEGYKLECLKKNPSVSFTVYNVFEVKETTSNWESAMLFGQAEIVDGDQSKGQYLQKLTAKYGGNTPNPFPPDLLKRFEIILINIEEFSGKIKK